MFEEFLWTNTALERAEPSLPLLVAVEVTVQVVQVLLWLTLTVRVMVQVEPAPAHTSLPYDGCQLCFRQWREGVTLRRGQIAKGLERDGLPVAACLISRHGWDSGEHKEESNSDTREFLHGYQLLRMWGAL